MKGIVAVILFLAFTILLAFFVVLGLASGEACFTMPLLSRAHVACLVIWATAVITAIIMLVVFAGIVALVFEQAVYTHDL